MAIGGCWHIDRPVHVQMLANAARPQIDQFAHRLFQLHFIHVAARTVQVEVNRQRMRHADRVADLDGAFIGKPRRHHVLRQIAAHIGGGPIHLGRVLAGKRAAAMRRRAAVCVHDDFPSRQPAIAIRAADDEFTGRVHVEFVLRAHPAGGQG